MNFKMNKFSVELHHLCGEALASGVPPYALFVIMQNFMASELGPMVERAIKADIENGKEEKNAE
jgi:hypothetical protein